MESKKPQSSGKNDNFRRKWDVAEYHIKAQVRANEKLKAGKAKLAHKPSNNKINATTINDNVKDTIDGSTKPVLQLLKAREYLVDLEKQVGKSVVINSTVGAMADGGYYCDVCDCSLRDSSNFLDHINGRKHQANLGISMKVERSNVDQVKDRIAAITKKKIEEKNQVKKEYDIDESITTAKELNEQEKKTRKEQKKLNKAQQQKQYEQDLNIGMEDEKDDMMRIMGFSSFGTSKK